MFPFYLILFCSWANGPSNRTSLVPGPIMRLLRFGCEHRVRLQSRLGLPPCGDSRGSRREMGECARSIDATTVTS